MREKISNRCEMWKRPVLTRTGCHGMAPRKMAERGRQSVLFVRNDAPNTQKIFLPSHTPAAPSPLKMHRRTVPIRRRPRSSLSSSSTSSIHLKRRIRRRRRGRRRAPCSRSQRRQLDAIVHARSVHADTGLQDTRRRVA